MNKRKTFKGVYYDCDLFGPETLATYVDSANETDSDAVLRAMELAGTDNKYYILEKYFDHE